MTEIDWPARAFEAERPHLRAVAYRMLGSTGEAEDAVQEAWLRLQRTDAEGIENLRRLADHGGRADRAEHAALARDPRASSPSSACRTRSSTRSTAPTPSTRRCSPTRSGSPC